MHTVNSAKQTNPSVLARETLKQLALLKIPPTPDNYFDYYTKIGGNPNNMPLATGKFLLEIAKELPRHTPHLLNLVNNLEKAAKEQNWSKYKSELTKVFIDETSISSDSVKLVPALKVVDESVDNHALNNFADSMLELVVQLLERISTLVINDNDLYGQSKELIQQVREIKDKQEFEEFILNFREFCNKFKSYDETDIKLQQELLKLLNLLLDSTNELFSEDQWIKSQISHLKEIMSKPLNMENLTKAEHYLMGIIQKQELITSYLGNARLTVKRMVSSLINNIEELSDSTGSYHNKLVYFSERVNKTNDLEQLNQLLVEIMQETQEIQTSVSNYREDLLAAREEVNKANAQIIQLETQLLEIGEKVQEDHLTGVFNRRGLNNAFEREISRAQRNQEPLCFVLLDLDNFKQLNDVHGHQVGDDALVFLANTIKKNIRPEDIISRYGGEEFAILLPSTMIEKAISISTRILRNLTKEFFLHDNKRLLITFSAGVAQLRPGESQESFFKRADDAMYRAKKCGKNQILAAE